MSRRQSSVSMDYSIKFMQYEVVPPLLWSRGGLQQFFQSPFSLHSWKNPDKIKKNIYKNAKPVSANKVYIKDHITERNAVVQVIWGEADACELE